MKIIIRKATQSDLLDIYRVEKRSYTPQLQATHKVLQYRMETFGIWAAEVNGKIRGFSTCVPVNMSWPHPNLKKVLRNRKPMYIPWFKEYTEGKKLNTLLVTSTAVESEWQGKGIGTALVKNSLRLAKKLCLAYRASALRCQYGKFYKRTGKSIHSYIHEVRSGRIHDRFLGLYLKLGFELGPALLGYEPHKGSMNYNVFAFKKV